MKSRNLSSTENFVYSVKTAVNELLTSYPLSSLQDIYKSFFQDEFGPGHLLENQAEAEKYFEEELGEMQSRQRYSIEPCGNGRHFFRIPMDLVKDGRIEKKMFLSSFFSGADKFRVPVLKVWKTEWNCIVSILETKKRDIRNFEEDKIKIGNRLDRGNIKINHSSLYRETYDPHYRIMPISIKHTLFSN